MGREDPNDRGFTGIDPGSEETAEVLGISRNTAKRDWNFAKVWLLRELNAALGE
jgi:hypothetical protein